MNDDVANADVGPVDVEHAPHRRRGSGCDGRHLLRDPSLSAIEERVPSGAGETRHRHAHARQFFYVLDGVATLEIDGIAHGLRTGQGLQVPPGMPHRLSNASERDLRFLVVSSPPGHDDRIDAPHPDEAAT